MNEYTSTLYSYIQLVPWEACCCFFLSWFESFQKVCEEIVAKRFERFSKLAHRNFETISLFILLAGHCYLSIFGLHFSLFPPLPLDHQINEDGKIRIETSVDLHWLIN